MMTPESPDFANATPPAERPDVVLVIAAVVENLPGLLARIADGGDPVLIAADGESWAGLASAADLAALERNNAEWAASGLGFDDEEAERIGEEINRAVSGRLSSRAGDARRAA